MRTPRRPPRRTRPEASSSPLGGGLEGALDLGLQFVLFWGLGFVLPLGLGFVLGWGACFETRLGGWGGGVHELLAVSGGRGQVVNAASALNLRLEDATTVGKMVGQGRPHLWCCNWLQMQLLQQGGDIDGPGVASEPTHDGKHCPRVTGFDLHILHLQRGRQKNFVPATFHQLVPATVQQRSGRFWRYILEHHWNKLLERRRNKSWGRTPRNFLALLAPVACRRGGYPPRLSTFSFKACRTS